MHARWKKSARKWLKNPQLARNTVSDLGYLILDNKLHASRDVIRTSVLLPKAAWTLSPSPPCSFFVYYRWTDDCFCVTRLSDECINRPWDYVSPDNKLMSREEFCNWCSRRDEIDVDLSNKEYLAPRRKEKRGREKEEEGKFIDFSARDSALSRCVLSPFRTNWFQLYSRELSRFVGQVATIPAQEKHLW